MLEQRIALSRITVDLRSRLAETDAADRPIPFKWIDRLHPLYASTENLGKLAKVRLPDTIAVFEEKGVIRAEAADGARIRIGTVENDPRGDSLFWQMALIYHLGPKYKNAEKIDLSSVNLAIFESKDRDPYHYLVGTLPDDNQGRLVVFEVYFPSGVSKEKHLDNLLAAFDATEAGR